MNKFDELLRLAVEAGATDIHIRANEAPVIRVTTNLKELSDEIIPKEEVDCWIKEIIKGENKYNQLTVDDSIDAGYLNEYGFYRINIYRENGQYALAIRILPSTIPTLDLLGLPKILKELCCLREGLVLITGATGNGKSTTLAGMVNEINQHYTKHIITIEDPIEYRHHNIKSIISQREIGFDCLSFPSALRSALRQDPDIILVGEMRDKETIETAITAAETGHLVLSTLHTNSASLSIERIMSAFDIREQNLIANKLSTCVKAIISQVLCRRIDNNKLVCAIEVLIPTISIQSLIREGKFYQISSYVQTNQNVGNIPLEVSLANLYKQGKISKEDAYQKANSLNYLEGLLKR